MTAQPGDIGGGRSTPWAADHPGAPQPDPLGTLWDVMPLVGGTPLFLLGLPAALAFAGASCISGRELWGGVAGGAIGIVLALVLVLVLVVVVLPGGGLAL